MKVGGNVYQGETLIPYTKIEEPGNLISYVCQVGNYIIVTLTLK